jgi:uncharacterized protein (TIGR01244 family)
VLEARTLGETARIHAFGDLWLASQPTAADLELAKAAGVRTVLSLRGADEKVGYDERAVAEGLGLTFLSLPWAGSEDPAVFDRARDLLATAERPLLFHCASANRVGALWIPWRVLDGGVSLEQALEEAKAIGLRSPDLEATARRYLERASAAE